jgi:hypothetical protein
MAHFAKLKAGNIVEQVIVVSNDVATTEQAGIDFLNNLYQDKNIIWKQTSYNNNIRKNFAGIGYQYDEQRDAFIPIKPFNSWILDEDTCLWKSPIERPITYSQNILDNNNNPVQDRYIWNELLFKWDLLEEI